MKKTTRNKLKKIYNEQSQVTNDIVSQIDKNQKTNINKLLKTNVYYFKKFRDISFDWEPLENNILPPPIYIDAYKNWEVIVENNSETVILPDVEILYRNAELEDNVIFNFFYKSIFYEFEYTENIITKIIIHAGIYFLETLDNPINPPIEVKLLVRFIKPNNYL